MSLDSGAPAVTEAALPLAAVQVGDVLPRSLPAGADWALFVDLDGTLCPLQDDPSAVALDRAQRLALNMLRQRLDGALCVLSGRSAPDLKRLLHGIEIEHVGDHGYDRDAPLPDDLARCLAQACDRFATLAHDDEHVWLERKRASCALHYRRAPHHAERLIAAAREIVRASPGLRLLEGNRVLELCASDSSKGQALRRKMRRAPFAGRLPIAIGDDVTDEDAFVAATALGGFGVAGGPRPSLAAR
jgi:trehalose 6-phosphate phosphatase